MLLSGDLLDGDLVFRETVQALARALGEIPCPVFLAPGNHDWYGPQSPYAALEWPGNVHLFTGPELGAVRLPELGCTVWGAAFIAPPGRAPPPCGALHAPAEGVQLAVLHGEVAAQGDYGPISEEDIAASGLDYLALGHVHASTAACAGQGRLSGLTPAAPRAGALTSWEKRACSGWRWTKGRTEAEFVPLCQPEVSDPVRGPDGAGGPRRRRAGRAAPTDAGRTSTASSSPGSGDWRGWIWASWSAELSPRFWGLTLRDHTRAARALWERKGEDTLTGLFLREMEGRCQAEPENEAVQLAVRFGLAALEHGEDVAL